jgi:hypothetical protein
VRFRNLVGPFLLTFALLRGQPNTVLRDTFADGERVTQNLPASAAWYTGNDARLNLAVRNGALTLVANGRQRDVWAYFPTVTLAIGDSLTFTVDFRWTSTPPNVSTPGFKIALCYSNGQAPRSADGIIPTGGYQGYGSFTNPADATSGTNLRKRNGAAAANPSATLLELTDGDLPESPRIWESLRTALNGTQQGGIPYTAILKITRTGVDTANIATTISGGTLSPNNTAIAADTSGIFSAFDTLAIGAANSTAYGDLLVTRAEVVHEVNSARLINLSILTSLTTPGDTFALGFVAGGRGTSGPKPLVIRAVGPSLGALGVPGTLEDPRFEVFAGGSKVGENDNWGGVASVREAMAAVGAFGFTGPTSLDAAVLVNAGAGNNSVQISGNGGIGQVIAEVYDATPSAAFSASTPRLINVSVLKHLGTELTVGFVVGGSGTKTVLVRAVGPTLGVAPFNVSGVVADPQLVLAQNGATIATNDNWGGGATLAAAFAQVAAFTLPANSRDAALVTTLAPGNYTVQVSGVGGTTGVALVEVYEVQ